MGKYTLRLDLLDEQKVEELKKELKIYSTLDLMKFLLTQAYIEVILKPKSETKVIRIKRNSNDGEKNLPTL